MNFSCSATPLDAKFHELNNLQNEISHRFSRYMRTLRKPVIISTLNNQQGFTFENNLSNIVGYSDLGSRKYIWLMLAKYCATSISGDHYSFVQHRFDFFLFWNTHTACKARTKMYIRDLWAYGICNPTISWKLTKCAWQMVFEHRYVKNIDGCPWSLLILFLRKSWWFQQFTSPISTWFGNCSLTWFGS